jgi:23S rRNA (guanosine2251-2'-O)-methyltransferase
MAFIYGIHSVVEALKSGKRRAKALVVSRSRKKDLGEILALANSRRVPVTFSDDSELNRKTNGGNHQGVLLDIEPVKERTLDEALGSIEKLSDQVWVALDEIEDPHNVGAILRSAAAFGAQVVILPERRSAHLSPTVEKVASGGAEVVKVVSVVNLNQAILQLKENGFTVYGASVPKMGDAGKDDRTPKSLYTVGYARPMLIVIGSEEKGLREKVAEKCDELVFIPQAPLGVESLNASCAASVVLYEVTRQFKSCQTCA